LGRGLYNNHFKVCCVIKMNKKICKSLKLIALAIDENFSVFFSIFRLSLLG